MTIRSIESVELHITDACTHRCPYCYADAKLTPFSRYADLGTITGIIDALSVANVKIVALLGGDPVRHPQFVEIAKYIKSRGMKVACMSNTMVIKGQSPEYMSSIIDNIDSTIHASNPEEHDSFCVCQGAYDLLMKQLLAYSNLGVTVNIVVNITPYTHDKIYDIVKNVLLRGVKVSTLLTQRILPFGRATNSQEYFATANQVNISFNQIERIVNDFGIGISVEDPYPLCCINEKFWRFMHGCPEGTTRVAIGLDGSVSRCGAVPEYSLGNVLNTPLLEIWEEADAFKSVRLCNHLILDECIRCELKQQCCGGCPVSCEMCNSAGRNFINDFRNGSTCITE